MAVWTQFLSLVVLVCIGKGGAVDHCHCSQVCHPQNTLCSADFAYRVHIHSAGDTVTPGETFRTMLHYPYWKYEAEIVEIFKAAKNLSILEEGNMTEFYSPKKALCGKTELYDEGEYDYLFTGYVGKTSSGYHFMTITICTWVEPWSSLTTEQKTGLRGAYDDCGCTIFPASGRLLKGRDAVDKFRLEDCLFNPVDAEFLKVPNCESLHGFCTFNEEDNTCSWENSGTYQECFEQRRLKLSQTGKPAVMAREDCNAYNGRKRKQCILKFLKNRNKGRGK